MDGGFQDFVAFEMPQLAEIDIYEGGRRQENGQHQGQHKAKPVEAAHELSSLQIHLTSKNLRYATKEYAGAF